MSEMDADRLRDARAILRDAQRQWVGALPWLYSPDTLDMALLRTNAQEDAMVREGE